MGTDTLLSLRDVLNRRQKFAGLQRGIYILIKNGIVVYVGQSKKSMYYRILSHAMTEDVDFDSFTMIVSSEENLDQLEADYMYKFAPHINRYMPVSSRYFLMGKKLKEHFAYNSAPSLRRKLRSLDIYPNPAGYYDVQEIEEAFAKEGISDER